MPKIAAPATRIVAPAETTPLDGGGVDPAVDLDVGPTAGAIQHLADPLDLRLALRDKGLSAEAGIDRHHEHVIREANDLLNR